MRPRKRPTPDQPPDVKREPVNYLWTALNWDFLRLLAEIAQYAAGKYGSAEQYTNARLEGDKDPLNHAFEHLTLFMAGVPHDRFGTLEHQLAAAAYNIMMMYFDLKVWGRHDYSVLTKQRMHQAAAAQGVKLEVDTNGKVVGVTALRSDAPPVALDATLPVPTTAPTTVPAAPVGWAEGFSHFKQRWQNGLEGARTPETITRWKAMLWVLSQFDEVAPTDDIVLPLIAELTKAAKAQLAALSTPENIEEQQARIAALDTLRAKIPDMFPAKAVV